MDPHTFAQAFSALRSEVNRVLLGQDEVVEQVLLAIFARGHVLIEGVPGLGKTLLVRTLGRVLGCEFKRIQFTPDLMPSDVTGGNVFNQQQNQFVFLPGPVFTQLLLADEINRAPAKTQSALLEAMQDRSVTVDGATRPLPKPFFTIATQNPVESQGTYPLPEAQLDRFLMKINVDHPTREVERAILHNYVTGFDAADLDTIGISQICSTEELLGLQAIVGTIGVRTDILDYITDVVSRTRSHRSVYLGASPRASISLLNCARARAASEGRNFVIPDDIKWLAPAILRHRLVLHPDAEIEGVTADDCVQAILREATVPQTAA
ncbi:MAG: MoxR family ATPase [Myxococcales bacterium]|nr:MoxR family ATPase [Myxococcales bacterium]